MAGSDALREQFTLWCEKYVDPISNYPESFVQGYMSLPAELFLAMRDELRPLTAAYTLLGDGNGAAHGHELIKKAFDSRDHSNNCQCNWCTHGWF